MTTWDRSMTKWATDIRQALDALGDYRRFIPEREYRILWERAHGRTYEQVATDLGLSLPRTAVLSDQALARVKGFLADTPAAVHLWERFSSPSDRFR